MPTGYTAKVQDGQITTLREFAFECARGMGALVTMRDDPHDAPFPRRIEPSTEYHDKALATADVLLGELPTLSAEECDARAKAEFDEAMTSHTRHEANRALSRQRYKEMIFRVENWQPPEVLASLKRFMLEQLNRSIDFDCSESYRPEPPKRLTGERWREQALEKASLDMAYHTVEREKEIQRTNGRNEWLAALWASLPPADPKSEAA